MGLIIKDKIPMLKKGYPTVSDKYNVTGGILAGTEVGHWGQLVKAATTAGYYAPVTTTNTISAVTDVMGIILATNVKVADFTTGEVVVNPGEAFNLFINGFIAVELAATATVANVVANAPVYVTAAGAFTDSADANKLAAALPNTVYTGVVENHGTTAAPVYYAEIYVK